MHYIKVKKETMFIQMDRGLHGQKLDLLSG